MVLWWSAAIRMIFRCSRYSMTEAIRMGSEDWGFWIGKKHFKWNPILQTAYAELFLLRQAGLSAPLRWRLRLPRWQPWMESNFGLAKQLQIFKKEKRVIAWRHRGGSWKQNMWSMLPAYTLIFFIIWSVKIKYISCREKGNIAWWIKSRRTICITRYFRCPL